MGSFNSTFQKQNQTKMFSHTFLGAFVTKRSHPGALQLAVVVFPPTLDTESPICRAMISDFSLILKCMYNDKKQKNKHQKLWLCLSESVSVCLYSTIFVCVSSQQS